MTQQLNTPNATDTIPNKSNTSLMIATALEVLRAGIYPFSLIPAQTLSLARHFIRGFICQNEAHYSNFSAFCQRILMARHYAQKNPGYQNRFSLLSWIDPENKQGFAGTAPWFDTLQDRRSIQPLYLLELKAFPEAILELAEEPMAAIYQYWNNWFGEKQARDVSLLFKLVGLSIAFPDPENEPR